MSSTICHNVSGVFQDYTKLELYDAIARAHAHIVDAGDERNADGILIDDLIMELITRKMNTQELQRAREQAALEELRAKTAVSPLVASHLVADPGSDDEVDDSENDSEPAQGAPLSDYIRFKCRDLGCGVTNWVRVAGGEFYAVYRGTSIGVVEGSHVATALCSGVPHSSHKWYPTKAQADVAFAKAVQNKVVKVLPKPSKQII